MIGSPAYPCGHGSTKRPSKPGEYRRTCRTCGKPWMLKVRRSDYLSAKLEREVLVCQWFLRLVTSASEPVSAAGPNDRPQPSTPPPAQSPELPERVAPEGSTSPNVPGGQVRVGETDVARS